MDLFYQMIPPNLTILYAWVSSSHICKWPKSRLDRNWYLFWLLSARLRVVKTLQIMHSDGLMTLYERICFVVCKFWHMPLTFYASSSYLLLYWAFLVTFCMCSVINAVVINAVKHQKVTKTLNNVINSSMQHKMSMAYVRIYTQQCIFFHKLSSHHQNDNFEAFSRLSMLVIADKTNTNSCQSWIFVNFTNVAPAHPS